jgi:hypothetical protein
VADAAEGFVGEAGPSLSRPVATTTEEVLVTGEPAVAPQERVAPEGMTRAASPEIQQAEEDTGATLSRAQQVVRRGPSSSPAPRGRLSPRPATTSRTMRR